MKSEHTVVLFIFIFSLVRVSVGGEMGSHRKVGTCICGIENMAKNVNDPKTAPFLSGNKYPWMVAIRKKVKNQQTYIFSTGTLVSDQFVVTTAKIVNHPADTPDMFEAKPG